MLCSPACFWTGIFSGLGSGVSMLWIHYLSIGGTASEDVLQLSQPTEPSAPWQSSVEADGGNKAGGRGT